MCFLFYFDKLEFLIYFFKHFHLFYYSYYQQQLKGVIIKFTNFSITAGFPTKIKLNYSLKRNPFLTLIVKQTNC